MAEFPAMTIWTDAYFGDTRHLGMLEHGAYLQLLLVMWRAGGYLPNDDAVLARYASGTPAEWRKVKPKVMPFFRVEGDQITQGRLLDELERARMRSKKQSDNARAKYRKNNNTAYAMAGAKSMPTASQNPPPTATDTDKEEKKTSSSKKGTRIPADFQADLQQAVEAGLRPERALSEAAKFRDYWLGVAGAKGVKLDWEATWRNWYRRAVENQAGPRGSPSQAKSAFREHQDEVTRNLERQINGHRTDDNGQPALDLDLDAGAFRSDRPPAAGKR